MEFDATQVVAVRFAAPYISYYTLGNNFDGALRRQASRHDGGSQSLPPVRFSLSLNSSRVIYTHNALRFRLRSRRDYSEPKAHVHYR